MSILYGLPPDLRRQGDVAAQAEYWHLPRSTWDALNKRVSGAGCIIAVLDTGYNPAHPMLKAPIAARSFVGGKPIDGNGHGSHCAGTACGKDPSITPAFNAQYIVAKVLDDQGSGGDNGINDAIDWASEEIATQGRPGFLSMSFGGNGPPNPTTIDALRRALARGVLPVVAAGNSGHRPGQDTIGEPGRRDEVLCIGAMGRNGNIATFSSSGRALDLAVPGEDIVSCSHRGAGMASMSGTSMATPFAAAICALIQELYMREGKPCLKGIAAWREFFSKNTDDKGEAGPDPRYGYGVPRYAEIVSRLVNDELVWV